jgi:hypothetical protein
MASNPSTAYGKDIACLYDADDLLSEISGLDVVKQDAMHRLLTDDVLGPGGTGWGYDCRKMLGMDPRRATVMGPILSEVLTRDDRIDTADVTITVVPGQSGLDTLLVNALCLTAFGPFDFTLDVASFSETTLTEQTA